eukprot:TRINITY_DN7892_c0_g1_i6.p4 TRINITY_DN7892_c0_g1~~TRINITY_DN7892_c0_g1_i6.p4  ORF type:complete len:102 (+),score=22.93 TRINITY_DN7892_c0_g1_i6:46-306(+)
MAFLGYLFGRQPDTSAVEQQAGLWGAEVYLVEHPELRGEDMFVTSQVVGDLVVAMPWSAGKIAVCDGEAAAAALHRASRAPRSGHV